VINRFPLLENGVNFREELERPGPKSCNLDLLLWQLVRARTAAPTYFLPRSSPLVKRRSNAEFSQEGLEWLRVPHINPAHLRQWDSVDFVDEMRGIGAAIARHKVKTAHFTRFLV